MWNRYLALFLGCMIVLMAVASGSGEGIVRGGDCTIPAPGGSVSCTITMDSVTRGLSEYDITVTVEDPTVAEIAGIQFPAWAGLNSRGKCPATTLTFKAADSGNKIHQGDRNVVLATLTIRGIRDGTTHLQVKINKMKDDEGAVYTTTAAGGTIKVGSGVGHATDSVIPTDPVPGGTTATPTPASTPTPDRESQDKSQYSLLPAVSPTPAEGGLYIASSPQGAEIFLDGQAAGITPLLMEQIPAGDHTLSLSKDGFIDLVYGTVRVETGLVTRITDIRLTPVSTTGTVSIDSVPRGAEVRLDGVAYGATPLIVSLDEGMYPLELTCPGYQPYSGEVHVIANEFRRPPAVVLTLLPRYRVSITTDGEGEVTPEGDVQVVEGGDLTLLIVPATGNQVSEILVDGDPVGPVSEYILHDVHTNHRVQVRFAPVPVEMEPDVKALPTPAEPDQTVLPPAEFSANVTRGSAPLTVAFNATGGTEIRTWNWQFGDGSIDTGQAVVHSYQEPGNFTVTLIVSSGQGATNESSEVMIEVIPVRPVLFADFSANITEGPAPLTVQFLDQSSAADQWLWEFGDGKNSTGQNPVHVFTESGNYGVNLTVWNGTSNNTLEVPDCITVYLHPIGGDLGYYTVHCNIENASVSMDGVVVGRISGGNLTVPVYVTGTPYRKIEVNAEGYMSYKGLLQHPADGQTIEISVTMIPLFPYDLAFGSKMIRI
jgi:PKD repeat protein